MTSINKKNKYSLVIPVYRNYQSLPKLLDQINLLNQSLFNHLEVVFVIDGSPDNSLNYLREQLPKESFDSQLISLSRNFGSFPAIIAGITEAKGEYFAVMAADLQDPPDLILKFFNSLEKKDVDIAIGVRTGRDDPFITKALSNCFWWLYRKFVIREIPRGGVDLFACNSIFRSHLISLKELNTSLIGLIFWAGFRREYINYFRLKRPYGKSAWNFNRKLRYLNDSIFAFSELPLQFIQSIGCLGILFSTIFGLIIIIARIMGQIVVPGYSAIILTIMFFSSLNIAALGTIGGYVWRTYENSKLRPRFLILSSEKFSPSN